MNIPIGSLLKRLKKIAAFLNEHRLNINITSCLHMTESVRNYRAINLLLFNFVATLIAF